MLKIIFTLSYLFLFVVYYLFGFSYLQWSPNSWCEQIWNLWWSQWWWKCGSVVCMVGSGSIEHL